MRSARRRSRELAVQGMYQWLHTGGTASKIIKDLADLDGFEDADGEFLAAELKGTIASVAQLRERLEPLADRPWAEVSPVERSILLIGAWEITHQKDIPFRVTINEAIELGKRFGGTDGHKYVNSILDKLAAQLRPGEAAQKPRQGKRRNDR